MLDMLLHILAAYSLSTFFLIAWSSFYKSKQKPSIITKNIISIIMAIAIAIIYLIFEKYQVIKIILTIEVMLIANHYLYRKNMKNTIISVLDTQIVIIVSELILMMFLSLIFGKEVNSFIDKKYSYFIINLSTAIIASLILLTKIPNKIYNITEKFTEKLKNSNVFIYALIILTISITSTAASYLNWSVITVLIINTSLILFFIFVSIKFAKAKNEFDEISSKYETSITSLREYEGMIDKYRIYNHENKNELQTLRNLISKKNTKALKYIDSILDNKIKDNEKIMHKTSKIPEGGLRATIYAKLCTMDELGIKYSLDIAKDIRTVDLINMKEDIVLNICKILGVFLDNAIEAVKDLKTKHIGIEIYLMDGDLCVDITNNYEGKLDINKIGSSKYTTKGEKHGYGLSLVNQIINDYPGVFENEKSITKNTFTQKIKIKM